MKADNGDLFQRRTLPDLLRSRCKNRICCFLAIKICETGACVIFAGDGLTGACVIFAVSRIDGAAAVQGSAFNWDFICRNLSQMGGFGIRYRKCQWRNAMYLIFGCMFAIVLLSILFCRYKRKKAHRRLCAMSCEEKRHTLEMVISPFGYCYDMTQDCFSTTIDAPQRAFGYTALYDRYAPRFGMVFDCLPVYFDYRGRTWLVEFWKGQYGVNLGCEVGIYKADGLVASVLRKTALFHSAEDGEMLPMSLRLYHRGNLLCEKSARHWWLTAFRMGEFCEPRDLEVQAALTFPNSEMLYAFAGALHECADVEYAVRGFQIRIRFRTGACRRQTCLRGLRSRYTQWKNRIGCRWFVRATRPFLSGMDRLLVLYFCLPRLIRRLLCFGWRGRCRKKSCRCCNRGGRRCKETRGSGIECDRRCERSCQKR